MPKHLRVILMVWLAAHGGVASAEMLLQSFDRQKHDRFQNDSAFIGNPYDWSGVGRVVGNHINRGWATMISPRHFLSANHFHPDNNSPGIPDTLRFYKTNDPLGAFEEHAVESGIQIAGSDLWLGTLQTPVGNDVATYPILRLPSNSDYDNRIIYTFGRSDAKPEDPQETNVRLGRNQIDPGTIVMRAQEAPSTTAGMSFVFDFDHPTGGVGADESYLQTFDSGGPSFIVFGAAPALVGIHWFIDPITFESGDTFVPDYLGELGAAMSDEHLTVVPEPAMLVMLLGLGAGCLVWSVWRRASR